MQNGKQSAQMKERRDKPHSLVGNWPLQSDCDQCFLPDGSSYRGRGAIFKVSWLGDMAG